jgi:hypothetical protein
MVALSFHLLIFTLLHPLHHFPEIFTFLQARISWLKPWLKMTNHTQEDIVFCCWNSQIHSSLYCEDGCLLGCSTMWNGKFTSISEVLTASIIRAMSKLCMAYLSPWVSRVWLTHHPDDGSSKDIWNFGKLRPVYTVLQSRRQPSSYSLSWGPQILLSLRYVSFFNVERKPWILLSETCT